LGKIIGGGLPVGAYGGRRDIMTHVSPVGDIYQAGTLSGNPLAMTAGLITLRILKNREIYAKIEEKSKLLFSGLGDAAQQAGIDLVINRAGSMGSIFFGKNPVIDYESVKKTESAKYITFYREMLGQKIYLAPSPFEALFVSAAHDDKAITNTIDAALRSFKKL
jgi:glutamate-1-semialdehyde 2,1-aminomutase